MPYYESVFIARPDISTTQVEAMTETLKSIIGENGGTVGKTEYWGLRNLSYRIKKNRKGHYSLMNLDAPPAAIREMERTLGINEDVLRYVTIRVEALEEEPSIMMRSKGQREERGRGGDRFGREDRFDRGRREEREPRGRRDEPSKDMDDKPGKEAAAEGAD